LEAPKSPDVFSIDELLPAERLCDRLTASGHSDTQKPRIARLFCLVGPHGLEPWTKGL
jgi:hypothetical protein